MQFFSEKNFFENFFRKNFFDNFRKKIFSKKIFFQFFFENNFGFFSKILLEKSNFQKLSHGSIDRIGQFSKCRLRKSLTTNFLVEISGRRSCRALLFKAIKCLILT